MSYWTGVDYIGIGPGKKNPFHEAYEVISLMLTILLLWCNPPYIEGAHSR